MTASDELRRIADSTSQLSDRKLVQVLDLAAIMPDQTQAQAIIERVRPRLAKIRPPRKAAIQRMFFNPVEDLFLSRDKNDQEKFCLTRYIIAPCWSLITQHCDPILLSTVADGLRDLYDHDHTKIITVMTPLWEAAHPILKSWLSERASAPMDSKGLRLARTEGKLRWQMAELAAILSVAREIEQAKMHLPCKPISRLSENDLGVIRATVTHLANAAPEKMPHFVRALAARMSRPGDMLKLLGDTELPLGSKETEAAVKSLSDNAFATLAAGTDMLKDMEAKAGDPGGVALEAERLTKALVSLEKNAAFWAHHAMVGQVRSVLKDVGRVIADRVTGRADAALSDAFAVELDEAEQDNAGDEERILERLEITESHALTLQRCARIADSTGFGVEVGTQIADVCRRIQQRAGGGGASDARGDRFLRAVRLTELVAGAEAAQQLLAKAPRFLMSTALGPDTSTTYAIDGADDGSPGQPETRDMELERFMRHISLADA